MTYCCYVTWQCDQQNVCLELPKETQMLCCMSTSTAKPFDERKSDLEHHQKIERHSDDRSLQVCLYGQAKCNTNRKNAALQWSRHGPEKPHTTTKHHFVTCTALAATTPESMQQTAMQRTKDSKHHYGNNMAAIKHKHVRQPYNCASSSDQAWCWCKFG